MLLRISFVPDRTRAEYSLKGFCVIFIEVDNLYKKILQRFLRVVCRLTSTFGNLVRKFGYHTLLTLKTRVFRIILCYIYVS